MNLRGMCAVVFLFAVAVTCWGQAPAEEQPKQPALTEQQKKRLEERDRLLAEAQKQAAAGKLPEVIATIEKVVTIDREVFGGAHETIAGRAEVLAKLHEQAEDFASARKVREEVAAIRSKLYGEDDWRVRDARIKLEDVARLAKLDRSGRRQLLQAEQLSGQAVQLYGQGKYREALELAERVRETRLRMLGEAHPDYAHCLANLAALYQTTGGYAQALPLLEQARDIIKKTLGETAPNYVATLNNLALLYMNTGNYTQARPLLEQTCDTIKRTQGESHSRYASSLMNLAALYHAMGDYSRALPLLEQARDIRRKAVGEAHHDYAQSLSNLAVVYQAMGDYAKALPLLEQAGGICKKSLGERHLHYAVNLHNLAALYQATGEYAKVLPLVKRRLGFPMATIRIPDGTSSVRASNDN